MKNMRDFKASAVKYMRSEFSWATTQRIVVFLYRRFGTTYRSHLPESKDSRILEDGTIGSSESWRSNYNYSLRDSPEKRFSDVKRN